MILCIETSGKLCSIALVQHGEAIHYREHREDGFSHIEQLHPMIKSMMDEVKVAGSDLTGIAVSGGPGSYTGLRIGVSAAKGLAFAWNLPLYAIPTLEILAQAAGTTDRVVVPMMDARRMEVYTAAYRGDEVLLTPQSMILDESSYTGLLGEQTALFLGDGVAKFQDICSVKNASFETNSVPDARHMAMIAQRHHDQNLQVDLAYYEPDYLKKFYTTAKKLA